MPGRGSPTQGMSSVTDQRSGRVLGAESQGQEIQAREETGCPTRSLVDSDVIVSLKKGTCWGVLSDHSGSKENPLLC